MEPDLQPRTVDLALEPAFSLGGLGVRPATLEVIHAGGREQLEPRIMQVLTALARRRGEVVSRDELIATCWDGRIVGDDSINRCIFRLRKLAVGVGGYAIETVPRVGFRLVETGQASSSARRRRGPLVAGGVALLIALAALAAWRLWPAPARAEPNIAIETFRVVGSDPAARGFADRLSEDITALFGEHVAGLLLPAGAAGAPASADLVLSGIVRREGQGWRVRAQLQDRRSGAMLWSEVFERPADQEQRLRDQVAVSVTETAITALDPLRQPGLRLDARTTALYLRAAERLKTRNPLDPGEAVRGLEEVVRRSPGFVTGRAYFASALTGLAAISSGEDAAAIRRRASQQAERAIRMNPHLADGGYDTRYGLALLHGTPDLVRLEDILLEGLRNAPDSPWLHMRECRFLVAVGRAREAVGHCGRAIAIRPLASPLGSSYASALAAAGQGNLADAAIARYARYHPDSIPTRRVRFEAAAFTGSPDEALNLLADPATRPQLLRPEAEPALRRFLVARRTPTSANVDAAIGSLTSAETRGDVEPRYVVFAAAALDRPDVALAALERMQRRVPFEPPTLLDPVLHRLRSEPRFWKAAVENGYVRYWRARNRWPDYCSEAGFDCAMAAAKAGG